MKTRINKPLLAALVILWTLNPQLSALFAQGNAFTYQGRLAQNSLPYSGPAEMQFTLFEVPGGGAAIAINTPAIASVNVSNGLFTVVLDFGATVFSGADRWLEIQLRTGLGAFTTLTPRQALTPTPYAIYAGKAMMLEVNGLRAFRLEDNGDGAPNVIGGSPLNLVGTGTVGATIGGGGGTNNFGVAHTNSVLADFGVVGGGLANTILANSSYATIAGGGYNYIDTNSSYSAIGGGFGNYIAASASRATIPGGSLNEVGGSCSFAAGCRATANHDGAFVWADTTGSGFASTAANQFLIRAAGGAGIGTRFPGGRALGVNGLGPASEWIGFQVSQSTLWHINNYNNGWNLAETGAADGRLFVAAGGLVGINTVAPEQELHVIGNILASGTITPNSDRNAKTAITSVDSAAILERVAKLPIRQWRFKAEAEGVKHIGPMAQDFQAAFGLGEHKTAIATVDADGVALAAIQGLNQKLMEESKQKQAEITELKQTVNELKELVEAMNERLNRGAK